MVLFSSSLDSKLYLTRQNMRLGTYPPHVFEYIVGELTGENPNISQGLSPGRDGFCVPYRDAFPLADLLMCSLSVSAMLIFFLCLNKLYFSWYVA